MFDSGRVVQIYECRFPLWMLFGGQSEHINPNIGSAGKLHVAGKDSAYLRFAYGVEVTSSTPFIGVTENNHAIPFLDHTE